jgi:xylulose-5-phosphate/fructose-6-phosphate phosphoketolase
MNKQEKALAWMKKYLRFTDYLGAAQLYLKDNFLLEEPLLEEHFKARILGHWGTVPGLNFIYANLNYLVSQKKEKMLLITGPGHGAPAILANLFLEGSLKEFYSEYSVDKKGLGKIVRDFSWPHSHFPSHVTPGVPGSILEGGELGYSLATAFGAVFDNPDLIATAIVGDGEAETGPIATAWHSNKFLNPKTSGAVLPVVHINGYKISNPTLFGTMSDTELRNLFKGYGYEPLIVKGNGLEKKMLETTEKAHMIIKDIQKRARKKKQLFQPKWPVVLLRTEKGWKGLETYHNKPVEGSFHSHGIPVGHPKDDKDALSAVRDWLKSYKIEELVDKKGKPKKEVLEFVPKGKLRLGMNEHAIGGKIYKKLKMPSSSDYKVKISPKKRGHISASSMKTGAKLLRDVIKKNKTNYRLFCPDEIDSNKLSAVFDVTKRAYMWPVEEEAENISPEGRVMEMLSEHTLQGWYQGYLLTGRHGMLVSYEAFLTIIASMVDQYAKFLKQCEKVEWRKPIAGAVYLLSSVGWRQDHNGYSHQNPSFVSNVLQKHGKFCQIYYPADANSFLVALEETMKQQNTISVIVAGKRDLPQWLTLKEARKQAEAGVAIWPWVTSKEEADKPDVVLASAGDYMTHEAMCAIKLCKELAPEIKIRYVNISEITALGLGDYCSSDQACFTEAGIQKYFTADRPVVIAYHGYVNDIEQILWSHTNRQRFSLHGYKEEGSTTTPFDMKVANGVSHYHLAIDLIRQAAQKKKSLTKKVDRICHILEDKIAGHQAYIREYGDDPQEVKVQF